MAVIGVSNLSFGHDGALEDVFENVSFNIDTSWKLGLIGRNGRGKTTLLHLLMGRYEFSGHISGGVEFSYFPYEPEDQSLDTIDIVGDDWKIYRELSLLNVSQEVLFRPFCTLSEGEKTKVLLAAMFTGENSFLLIDEPTNHLDARGRQLLSDYLKKKQGFILVSHDRCFVDNCVDHIMSINKTNIEIVAGNFSSWSENKQRQDNFEQTKNTKLKKEISRLSYTAKEKSAWSDRVEATKSRKLNPDALDRGYIGHQAAKMMKRSKAIEKRIEGQISEKSSLLKNIETAENLKISPLVFHSKRLVQGEQIGISYDGQEVFGGLDFEILQGQKVNIVGKNGSGKSSLIKLILGEEIEHSGSLFIAKGICVSYVSQDTTHLKGYLADLEETHHLDATLFRAILRKLDFSRHSFEKPMQSYSAGQKKKVLIAKSLSQRAHLYVWDEPLNYIDILSRIQIEKLVKESEMSLIFVEHDKMFCENIADEVITLN